MHSPYTYTLAAKASVLKTVNSVLIVRENGLPDRQPGSNTTQADQQEPDPLLLDYPMPRINDIGLISSDPVMPGAACLLLQQIINLLATSRAVYAVNT
jgi:hypothetical protein